jgi:hypothetical protein
LEAQTGADLVAIVSGQARSFQHGTNEGIPAHRSRLQREIGSLWLENEWHRWLLANLPNRSFKRRESVGTAESPLVAVETNAVETRC